MYNNFNLNDYKSIVLYLPNYLHYEYTNCVQNVLVPSLQKRSSLHNYTINHSIVFIMVHE